jgi:hypothetical protein
MLMRAAYLVGRVRPPQWAAFFNSALLAALTFGGRKVEGLSDHALSSSTKPGGIFGGLIPSLALQIGHGIPGAPQPQA